MRTTDSTVLVVDDKPAVADGHAAHLGERYDVRVAYSGEGALEQLDASVRVVLLDRRIPECSGDRVLSRIRERELPCRVAMLTGVEPEFDIVDMGFDEYLRKPVSRDELFDTVEMLLQRAEYDSTLQKYFSAASKLAALETEHSDETLAGHEEYRKLRRRTEELQSELDETLADLPTDESYAIATGGEAADRLTD